RASRAPPRDSSRRAWASAIEWACASGRLQPHGRIEPVTQEPQAVYEIRVEARRAEVRILEERDRRLSIARAIVAALALISLIVTASRPMAVFGLVIAAVVFVALVIVHEKLARRLSRARRRVAFYEAAIGR